MKKSLLIPVLAAVALSGCSLLPSKTTTPTPTPVGPTPTAQMSPAPEATGSAMEEVVEFTVEGSEFKFTPKVLNAKAGDRVRIIFKNTGKMMHDLRLDEFNAATKVISGGQQEIIEFVAERVGAFEFYCSVNSHRQMGMVGTLNVR